MRTGTPRPRPAAARLEQISESRLLGTIRDFRFAAGLACVHCQASRVVRWGGFSGRQRYRCRECGRTFSDLTKTPLAYTKKLSTWPAHMQRLRLSRTLRDTASDCGIHLSTAFRWRHAALSGALTREPRQLGGWIELAEVVFAYSEKGSRSLESPRRCGAPSHVWEWFDVPREPIAVLRSRSGATRTISFPGGIPDLRSRHSMFSDVVLPGSTLLCGWRAGAVYGHVARARGHTVIWLRSPAAANELHHTGNVDAYVWRLRDWILRFRGVATKYLPHYLAWHRIVDVDTAAEWFYRCAGPPRQGPHSNTSREHRLTAGGDDGADFWRACLDGRDGGGADRGGGDDCGGR